MLTLTQIDGFDIINALLVIIFWLAPTVYGITTFVYFITRCIKRKNKFRYQNRPKTNYVKLPIILLIFNFVNFTWAWMSSFLFIMLMWGAHVGSPRHRNVYMDWFSYSILFLLYHTVYQFNIVFEIK